MDICCLADARAFLRQETLEAHGLYYYIPNLLKHFSTSDINALIAPRPHVSLAGVLDPYFKRERLFRDNSAANTEIEDS